MDASCRAQQIEWLASDDVETDLCNICNFSAIVQSYSICISTLHTIIAILTSPKLLYDIIVMFIQQNTIQYIALFASCPPFSKLFPFTSKFKSLPHLIKL